MPTSQLLTQSDEEPLTQPLVTTNRKRKDKPEAKEKLLQQKKRSLSSPNPNKPPREQTKPPPEATAMVISRAPLQPDNSMTLSPMTRATMQKMQEEQGPSAEDLIESFASANEQEKQCQEAMHKLDGKAAELTAMDNTITMMKWDLIKVSRCLSIFVAALG
jgi:hypothetical protein